MLYIIAFICGCVLPLLYKRKQIIFKVGFKDMHIRGWFLLPLAVLLRYVGPLIYENYGLWNSVSLLLCSILMGLNLNRLKGLWWMFLGTMMNTFVILINKGKMPVSTEHIPVSFDPNKHHFYQPLTEQTWFPYFADVIPFINPSFSPSIMSVGDVFICVGCFLVGYHLYTKKSS